MKNKIYNHVAIGEDEEIGPETTSTQVIVTEEANVYIVWQTTPSEEWKLLRWFHEWERNAAIEYAVDRGRALRSELLATST